MPVAKDTRQYIITYMKRKYEWQIKDMLTRIETLEKTIETLSKVVEHLHNKQHK